MFEFNDGKKEQLAKAVKGMTVNSEDGITLRNINN
jgi:hypothetical protein